MAEHHDGVRVGGGGIDPASGSGKGMSGSPIGSGEGDGGAMGMQHHAGGDGRREGRAWGGACKKNLLHVSYLCLYVNLLLAAHCVSRYRVPSSTKMNHAGKYGD
jgi:hypothetical protein